jgi:type IV fimbrial biogenesis protein FimT
MMIVLVIVTVTLLIAGPGFMQSNLNSRLKAFSNAMISSIYTARGEAIKRNVPVRICASADGATCASSGDWEQGWVVMDPNDVVIERQLPLSTGYKLTSTGGLVLTFQPSGIASTVSTMKICRQAPEVGNQEREILISGTGRPNLKKTENGSCPA